MKSLSSRQRLEVGAYIVTIALAAPSFVLALIVQPPLKDFLINISATFAGAGFLFFLLNRFFGLENSSISKPEDFVSASLFFKEDFVDLRDRFRKAKTIAINGITLSRTSNTYLNELKDCLDRGGEVRIMLVDPNSSVLEAASQRFYKHQDISKVRRECEQALDNFETLLSHETSKKSAEIRLCNAVPPFGIWLIDVEARNAEIWAEIYSYRGARDPAMQFVPHRDGQWFDYFADQFELLWRSSKQWIPTARNHETNVRT